MKTLNFTKEILAFVLIVFNSNKANRRKYTLNSFKNIKFAEEVLVLVEIAHANKETNRRKYALNSYDSKSLEPAYNTKLFFVKCKCSIHAASLTLWLVSIALTFSLVYGVATFN